jgi:ribose transport system ATP-binding protein
MALVPADRAREGVAAMMSIEDNMLLLAIDRYHRRGWLRRRLISRTARSRCATFDIRPPEPAVPLSMLSGGNQQKVVLAKWLEIRPRVMLLHGPTQGVDVGARVQVYQLVRDATAAGTAVLWATPEFEELAEMCDRVLVMADGRVAGEIRGPSIDKDEISHAVFAATAGAKERPR